MNVDDDDDDSLIVIESVAVRADTRPAVAVLDLRSADASPRASPTSSDSLLAPSAVAEPSADSVPALRPLLGAVDKHRSALPADAETGAIRV